MLLFSSLLGGEMGRTLSQDAAATPYGEGFAGRFHLQKPKYHVSRMLKRGVLAVTQLKSEYATPEPSQSIGYDEAFLIGLMVDAVPDHELWQDGRAAKTEPFRAGDTALYDLRRDPISFTRCPHHSLHFYLPRSALKALAAQSDLRFHGELNYRFATGYDDRVIRQLGAAMLPSLEHGKPLDGLFLDYVLLALATHVLSHYGDGSSAQKQWVGGLSMLNLRRAQEMLRTNLASDISLAELADSCGLSPAHFARAFRQSTGRSAHVWLQQQRVNHAKTLLKGELALPQIALACGFANQSHFTHVFSKLAGTSPGRWRRMHSIRLRPGR